MSTSQDYPNTTPTPATTTARGGQRRGPSLRDISQQQLNAATQYMIDELMSQGMSEKEAIGYLERELEKAIPDDFWESYQTSCSSTFTRKSLTFPFRNVSNQFSNYVKAMLL